MGQISHSERASFHPFLPAGIDRLASVTSESSLNIISQQTLAPLFIFFLPVHSQKLLNQMRCENASKAYRTSQLPSFSSGSTLHLKFCSICASNDIFRYGVAYWHRIHQVPGITACPYHGISLGATPLPHRQRLLPNMFPPATHDTFLASCIEVKLARFTDDLLCLLSKKMSSGNFIQAYRSELYLRDLITDNQRVRRKKLLADFFDDVQDYPASLEAPLPYNKHDYRYLSELLIPSSSRHPFRHLLFAAWLFKSASTFIKASMMSENGELPDKLLIPKDTSNKKVEATCLFLLREGYSLNAIYKQTGKSRCYLKRLALLNNIHINLNPKILSPTRCATIIRLARSGMHRKAIAERCQIGVGSVEQIIASTPGLSEHRRILHKQSVGRRYKVKILRYQQEHLTAIRKDYQIECNQAYHWLFNNNRDWLESVLPPPLKPAIRL